MDIKKLDIVYLETKSLDNKSLIFDIKWEVDNKPISTYNGDYIINIYKDDEFIKNYQFKGEIQLSKTVTITDIEIDYNSKYSVDISIQDKSVKSEKQKLIIDVFNDLTGVFDGEMLTFQWNVSSQNWLNGICEVVYSTGATDTYSFNYANCIFQVKPFLLSKNSYINVYLKACDGVSYGLQTQTMRFNQSGIEIINCDFINQNNKDYLSIDFESLYDDLNTVNMYILHNNSVLSYYNNLKTQENKKSLLFPLDDIDKSSIKNYKIRLTAQYENAETNIINFDFPLLTPIIKLLDVKNEKYIFGVDMPDILATSFVVNDTLNNTLNIGYEPFEYDINNITSIKVRAIYKFNNIDRYLPFSDNLELPICGYYPYKDDNGNINIKYLQNKNDFNSLNIDIQDLKGLKEDVSINNIIKLNKSTGLLEVSNKNLCTPEHMQSFMLKLDNNVTAYTMYMLKNSVLRLANIQNTDTSTLLYGYEPQNRCADIVPSMALEVTTSSYIYQDNSLNGITSGFVNSSVNTYPVIIRKNSNYLEFDCFASNIAQYMSNQLAYSNSSSVVYVSSIMDLSHVDIKKPYYKVLFPSTFRTSTALESPNPSDNFVILATDSYEKMKNIMDTIKSNPKDIDNINSPVIIFRGRSTLSLKIVVFFENNRLFVPVDTKLADILQMYNIDNVTDVKLYRRNADGKKTEVYLNNCLNTKNIVLISGDMIYIK